MNTLYAPWRTEYIKRRKIKRCLFCRIAKDKRDKENFVFLRSKYFFSMLNLYPYNAGHTMISPYRHIKDTLSLKSPQEIGDLISTLNRTLRLLNETLRPEGYNIGINLGEISGAGIPDHFHIHVVPRWKADTNFMPVISDTKIVSQSLDSLYRDLIRCRSILERQKNKC